MGLRIKIIEKTTIFNKPVFLSDSWHLFGLIRDLSIVLCIPIITLNPYYLLIYPVYRGIFHIMFTYLLNKK